MFKRSFDLLKLRKCEKNSTSFRVECRIESRKVLLWSVPEEIEKVEQIDCSSRAKSYFILNQRCESFSISPLKLKNCFESRELVQHDMRNKSEAQQCISLSLTFTQPTLNHRTTFWLGQNTTSRKKYHTRWNVNVLLAGQMNWIIIVHRSDCWMEKHESSSSSGWQSHCYEAEKIGSEKKHNEKKTKAKVSVSLLPQLKIHNKRSAPTTDFKNTEIFLPSPTENSTRPNLD